MAGERRGPAPLLPLSDSAATLTVAPVEAPSWSVDSPPAVGVWGFRAPQTGASPWRGRGLPQTRTAHWRIQSPPQYLASMVCSSSRTPVVTPRLAPSWDCPWIPRTRREMVTCLERLARTPPLVCPPALDALLPFELQYPSQIAAALQPCCNKCVSTFIVCPGGGGFLALLVQPPTRACTMPVPPKSWP
mgnify:CR=1 FL=1